MKTISYDNAIKLINNYTDKLARENKLDPKTDEFTVVLPLEDREGLILNVAADENGQRKVKINISDNILIMHKVKNTGLTIFHED
jgi:hypothetical protein